MYAYVHDITLTLATTPEQEGQCCERRSESLVYVDITFPIKELSSGLGSHGSLPRPRVHDARGPDGAAVQRSQTEATSKRYCITTGDPP